MISLLCALAAAVKDIDRYQEKITVSLHPSSLSASLEHVKLGVVASEELPKHYRCGRAVQNKRRRDGGRCAVGVDVDSVPPRLSASAFAPRWTRVRRTRPS